MKRRTARIKAVQTIYQVALAKTDWEEALGNVLEEEEDSDPFLEDVTSGVVQHLDEIDTNLRGSLKNWSLERLSHVDLAILRLAIYELKYREDVPNQVVINEAIELGKAFGTEQSSKFINGVLSNVVKQGE